MKSDLIRIAALAALTTLAGAASADHNSKWGEGWAKMPNDIHNTRVETRGDNNAFRDFVKKGAGAESENRFDTDDKGRAAQSGDDKPQANADRKAAQSAAKASTRGTKAAQAKEETRDRERARAELRRNDRSAMAARSHTRSMRGAGGRGRR